MNLKFLLLGSVCLLVVLCSLDSAIVLEILVLALVALSCFDKIKSAVAAAQIRVLLLELFNSWVADVLEPCY